MFKIIFLQFPAQLGVEVGIVVCITVDVEASKIFSTRKVGTSWTYYKYL